MIRILILVTLLGVACAPRYRLDIENTPTAPSPEVVVLWQEQRDVLVRILRDKKFTLREFHDAVAFFERLTCLPSRHHSSPFGPVPSELLAWDLDRWDDWLRSHGSRITVDEDGRTLLGPDCGDGE